MAEIRSQQDQRVHTPTESGDFFYDQHGRAWHAEVEIKTQHPCSPYSPVGWTAPLDPPRNYFKFVRGLRLKDAKRAAEFSAQCADMDETAGLRSEVAA